MEKPINADDYIPISVDKFISVASNRLAQSDLEKVFYLYGKMEVMKNAYYGIGVFANSTYVKKGHIKLKWQQYEEMIEWTMLQYGFRPE